MARVLSFLLAEDLQIQYKAKYKERDSHESCGFDKPAFHGTALILTPVSISYSGDRAKTLLLALLHQYDNSQSDTIYCINYSQNNLQNVHAVTPPNQLEVILP